MGTNHDSCGLRRRTGLNTTAKFTIASVALLLSPAAAEAASQSVALQVVWSAASTGQSGANANREAEELLSKARQAMNEDNFELADSYIARAERTGPKYSVFHLGDTPKKAREDLQKKLAARKGGTQKSRFFGGKEPPQDPFAVRRASHEVQEPQLSTAGSAFPADRGPVVGDMVRRGGQSPAPRTLSPAQGNAMNQIAGPQLPHDNVNAIGMATKSAPATGASADGKSRALELTRQARAAMVRGDLNAAEQLATQAQAIAPDSAFGPGDDRPGLVLYQIKSARLRTGRAPNGQSGVVTAGGPTAPENGARGSVVHPLYDPRRDTSRNVPAQTADADPRELRPSAQDPAAADGAPANADSDSSYLPRAGAPETGGAAARLMKQGEQALTENDPKRALQLFQQAYRLRDELNPQARASLQMHLQVLSRQAPMPRQPAPPANFLEGVAENQQALGLQVAADVTRAQSQAKAMLEKEPKRALEVLQQMRHNLETLVQLDPAIRDAQLRRLDITLNEANQYMREHAAQIALDDENRSVEQAVEANQQKRIVIDDKLAAMVDEFNRLSDEQRFAEAELVAKRARAMDPENPIISQIMRQAKVQHRLAIQQDIGERKEDAFIGALTDVDEASIPGDYDFRFPEAKVWTDLTKTRLEREAMGNTRQTERERRIEAALKTPVLLKYENRPLAEVLLDLGKLADINIHPDWPGMASEGIDSSHAVSINLSHEISLKSALLLILEPLRLNYVITNDVLKVTSSELTNNKVYTKSYPVGDLIIPIPNFVPDGREGINAALQEGYRRAGYGGVSGFGVNGAPTVMVADAGKPAQPVNPAVNAQIINRPDMPPATGVPQNIGFGPQSGPGGLAGGSQADFDALIDLITATIAPDTWDTVGGPGSVAEFETNLTLVVSQTQEVHEQIADLLNQLRRLQDLQVTIEVRFITLNDNFFERIGIDFDFNIDDNFTQPFVPINQDGGNSAVIGLDPVVPLTPTANLDLQFRQGSFGATVPNIPGIGFDPMTAGTFGFAILSDIEAFFLIQAASGDSRSNILQAPKVTLFNGQTAFISDTSQRPFVTSIIPVVGDFAAAQQPVIVVLSEGTSLTVSAVVSNDRRFVRLTVVPFFSQIGDVEEFTFTGSKTTSKKSSESAKKGDDETSEDSEDTVSEEGTTVQLPTFSFVTVTSTVSVPDGGTVLLGGIKRMNEGRIERGLPILSKLPYINRLFKNVGIGRSTSSLMMMVTPRIIIQEEEEAKLIGTTP
jgi:general secretion pathway protein D